MVFEEAGGGTVWPSRLLDREADRTNGAQPDGARYAGRMKISDTHL